MMRIIKVWSSMPSQGLIKDISRMVKMIIHTMKKRSYGPHQSKRLRREDIFNKTHQNMSDKAKPKLDMPSNQMKREIIRRAIMDDLEHRGRVEDYKHIIDKLRKTEDGKYLDLT